SIAITPIASTAAATAPAIRATRRRGHDLTSIALSDGSVPRAVAPDGTGTGPSPGTGPGATSSVAPGGSGGSASSNAATDGPATRAGSAGGNALTRAAGTGGIRGIAGAAGTAAAGATATGIPGCDTSPSIVMNRQVGTSSPSAACPGGSGSPCPRLPR